MASLSAIQQVIAERFSATVPASEISMDKLTMVRSALNCKVLPVVDGPPLSELLAADRETGAFQW